MSGLARRLNKLIAIIIRKAVGTRRYGHFFVVAYALALMALCISASFISSGPSSSDYYEPLGLERTELRDVANFKIGINLTNVWQLDLSSKTFNAEGYVWLKWIDLPEWLAEWDPDVAQSPPRTIGFVNAVERYDFVSEVEPSEPWVDSDGEFIQWLFFSGKFIARDLDFRKFPFEEILLPVEVEMDDYFSTEARFEFVKSGEVVASNKSLHGYLYGENKVFVRQHVYPTDWGQAEAKTHFGIDKTKYTNLMVALLYERDWRGSLFLVFSPLIVVMSVVALTPLIELEHYDAKVALPASVLLVLVFLQDGYRKMLPVGLEYPTYADYVYTMCMVITAIVFVWSLLNTNIFLKNKNDSQVLSGAVARSDRRKSERRFFRLTLAFLLVSPVALWLAI